MSFNVDIMWQGDLNVLRERCSREVVERCRAERQALESQGIFLDNKVRLLHVTGFCLHSFHHGFYSPCIGFHHEVFTVLSAGTDFAHFRC